MRIRRILTSLVVVAVAGGAAFLGTSAFFSDTEVSEGNVLSAGSIDLVLTNEASASEGVLNQSQQWFEEFDDINNRVMLNFKDIKPGDWGENTVGLKVIDNNAWVCAEVNLADKENEVNEPESKVPDNTPNLGELSQAIEIIWWADDGDNILEQGEQIMFDGPVTLETVKNKKDFTLADSSWNAFTNSDSGPMLGAPEDYHIGIGWCLGDLNVDYSNTERGFTCDGTNVSNIVQTDSVEGSLSFSAVQSRNNEDFLCPENQPQILTEEVETTGWSFLNTQAFVGEGRIGLVSAPYELDIQDHSTGSNVLGPTDEFPWVSGEAYDFSLTYDGNDQVVLNVGGVELTRTLTNANPTFDTLFLRVRAPENGTILLDNLDIDGSSLSSVSISNGGKVLIVEGANPGDGFTLTGEATMSWTGTRPTQSNLAFQLIAGTQP